MVTLFEQDVKTADRQSSKGNQLKWIRKGIWYKADYTGYEGLSEYIISNLLIKSSLKPEEYVLYGTENICYGTAVFHGCESADFLKEGEQLITLERLFAGYYGESLYKSIYKIHDYENRLRFLVEQTERITGLKQFDIYLCKLLTIDAFFLNEDRHTHNIAVIKNDKEEYRYCPVFDNGAALLSDTTMDYPMGQDIFGLMGNVRAKTFCESFDEQLDIAEKLYGDQIYFTFERKDVEKLLEIDQVYPAEIKERVMDILMQQMRKYQYLFK